MEIVQQVRFGNVNPTLLHIRLIDQETAVGEASANNIGMRASHPDTTFFVLVQDDQIMTVSGWNILLSEPIDLYSDVFSVSARCAHPMWSEGFGSFKGRCGIDINAPLSMSAADRCKFDVRDTVNRGPLLLHAARTRQLGYLDEQNYWIGDDDHHLNFRAYAAHRWVAAFRPIDFDSPLRLGGTRRQISVPTTKNEDQYRIIRSEKRARQEGALQQFLSRKWLNSAVFVTLDIQMGSVNFRTLLQQQNKSRQLTQSHDETRSLNKCNLSIEAFY